MATLAELGLLEAGPVRLGRASADGLSFHGMFRLLAGDLNGAVSDLSASVGLARREAGFRAGLSVHCYLALAQTF